MMWNDLVHSPARSFQRACLKKLAVQKPGSCPYKVANHPRSDFFYRCCLLQLTGSVYNLHVDLDLRRASSRQDCNP
jgi:hypothetical protein